MDVSSPPPADPQVMDLTGDDQDQPLPHIRYKSYRKKWRKMRIKFEHAMEEANDLFIREHKAWEVAKRIQEQNDSLLDLVHDLELDGHPDLHDSSSYQTSVPEAFGLTELTHSTNQTAYPVVPDAIEHLIPSDVKDIDAAASTAVPPGYLTLEHQSAYLVAQDTHSTTRPQPDNLPANMEAVHHPLHPPREKHHLRETDFSARHPASVHNWLRRNKPEIFGDKSSERTTDKSGQSPAPSSKKKKTKADLLKEKEKQDTPSESLDEDAGSDPPNDTPGASARNKKKLPADDVAYRPKGGHSRAGAKRKRSKVKEEEPDGVKRFKTSHDGADTPVAEDGEA